MSLDRERPERSVDWRIWLKESRTRSIIAGSLLECERNFTWATEIRHVENDEEIPVSFCWNSFRTDSCPLGSYIIIAHARMPHQLRASSLLGTNHGKVDHVIYASFGNT